MSRTIVLEPFSKWVPEGTVLTRKSDRHSLHIEFRQCLHVVLTDPTRSEMIDVYERDELHKAVQFVDNYIATKFLPAKDAVRALDHLSSEVKRLEDLLPKDNEGPTPCPES